jgi:hypothetical protein
MSNQALDLLKRFADREGWNDETLLRLLSTYVSNQESLGALEEFLEEVAACSWCGGIGFAIPDESNRIEKCDACEIFTTDDGATLAACGILTAVRSARKTGVGGFKLRGVTFEVKSCK